MGKERKWYVVWRGHQPDVYATWAECWAQVRGYSGALYRSFPSEVEARRAFEDGAEGYSRLHSVEAMPEVKGGRDCFRALAVDAACSGNPGLLEYRGVMTDSLSEVFRVGPLEQGTNNIGEFLAIVHGLAYLQQQGLEVPIFSDSMTGISWVKKKRCKTLLKRTPANERLFDLIARAEAWLHNHSYTTPIYKWDTMEWGEIPADFGRKGR